MAKYSNTKFSLFTSTKSNVSAIICFTIAVDIFYFSMSGWEWKTKRQAKDKQDRKEELEVYVINDDYAIILPFLLFSLWIQEGYYSHCCKFLREFFAGVVFLENFLKGFEALHKLWDALREGYAYVTLKSGSKIDKFVGIWGRKSLGQVSHSINLTIPRLTIK